MGSPLTIALVAQPGDSVWPPAQGSSLGIWVYEIARRLAAEHRVVVYASPQPGASPPPPGVEYVPTRSYPDRLVQRWMSRRRRWQRPQSPVFASPLSAIGYYGRIALDLRKRRCDVVHVLTYQNALAVLGLAGSDVKMALHRHDNGLMELEAGRVQRQLARAALIIGCSDFVTGNIRERFPALAERCHTLVEGVDTDRFAPADGQPGSSRIDLLYVGRLAAEKGVHELLRAFVRIADRHPEAHLTLVGPYASLRGEFIRALLASTDDAATLALESVFSRNYRELLESIVPERLQGRVTFAGHRPASELHTFYQRADVFVFPSVWQEPFGMPVIEAMATGVPVVATRSGGIPEVMTDGETGLLVARGDAVALAAAIEHLIDRPEDRRRMGANGRLVAQRRFAWDLLSQHLVTLYRRIL